MTTLVTESPANLSVASAKERPAMQAALSAPPRPEEKPARLTSLDAYRGFIMLAMASSGLAIPTVAKSFPDNPVWRFFAFHSDHVAWEGCGGFWDLIQPSFMFMVGVALPYSYASRKARGDKDPMIFLHTLWRSLLLVLLAVFLSSPGPRTDFIFVNVLAQIGLGYTFLFLLVGQGLRWQMSVLAVILVGYTLFFGLFPAPVINTFPWAKVGVTDNNWPHLQGWFAHWDKNSNAAAFFDVWFLNLFPRQTPFVYNGGGYQTLNFIPSLATMLLGLMAGEFLRGPGTHLRRFTVLVIAGAVCLAVGLLMGAFVCPLVKRIWTPSWAVYSAGWTFWMLAGFYGLIDGLGWRRWAFPFVVVGMNSIAMYCLAQLMKSWISKTLQIHMGSLWLDGTYGPIVEQCAILLVLWLICLWMYRRGVFLRI
jgi:heparan-alpha-glucosaminide N-acetyltransferase